MGIASIRCASIALRDEVGSVVGQQEQARYGQRLP